MLHGNPPLTWSEEKNVKWKVAIPGRGHATPIIWEDKVFVLTAVPVREGAALENLAPQVAGQAQAPQRPPREGGRPGGGRPGGGGFGGGRPGGAEAPVTPMAFTVLCLDRATGKPVWERIARQELPHERRLQPSNSYSSGSPVTDGERLYVSFGSHGVHCYDFEGNRIWEKDLGQVNVTFGEASSPTLAGDALIVLQDNNGPSFIHALDKRTGRELWKTERREGSGWTTPLVLREGDRTEVIVSGSNAVRAYDAKTGEQIWECAGLGSNPVPMIVANETALFAMSGHRDETGLAIRRGRQGNLTGTDAVLWTNKDRITPYVPSPLLFDDVLLFCQRTTGILSAVHPITGEAHYAQERVNELGSVYASPILAGNRIYWPGQNGATVVLERSRELKVLATNTLNDGFDASPAVVGNELFLRGREHLYCLVER